MRAGRGKSLPFARKVEDKLTEFQKAQAWREKQNLSRKELGDAIGYSPISIYWFERGETPPARNIKSGSQSREIKPWVWLRYKMACAGYKKRFDW